jgi:hypothetical protein
VPTAGHGWHTCKQNVDPPEMYSAPLLFDTSQGSAYISNLPSTPPQTPPYPYDPFQVQPAEVLHFNWDSTSYGSPPQHIYSYNGYNPYPPSHPSPPIDYNRWPRQDTFATSFINTEGTRTNWGDVFKEKNKAWDGSISRGSAICARRDVDEYIVGYPAYAQHVDGNLDRRYRNKCH